MSRIIILHSNDIHGHVEGMARIGTLVSQIRAENDDAAVLYFDVGDSEEYANRLSSLTKGIAVHRLLAAAGCDGVVVGNAILARYGPKAVTDQAAAIAYPHLAANVRFSDGRAIPGTQPTAVLQAGPVRLGLIGVTAEMDNYVRFFDLQIMPTFPLVHELIAELHDAGADAVILLSHLGLEADRKMATALPGDVPLILGGHSHSLLPEGERVGDVLIAQAGEYAQHLGRVELDWDGHHLRPIRATVLPVTEAISPSPGVQAMISRIEAELEEFLGEIICELAQPLDYATDRECGIGNLMADALRHRADAEIAVAVPGPNFTQGLPAGPLHRETLWTVCPSVDNPGVVNVTGVQLAALVQRGLDPEFAADRHRALRGSARGLMHLSGAVVRDGQLIVNGQPLDPERSYRVAGCTFEFEPVWGYADEVWQLAPDYELDVILREAVDEYVRTQNVTSVEMGRLA
jgi:2',3'-cyclic-nucleotide 2'-phosphodiesterase (5'-nucleotidase family)